MKKILKILHKYRIVLYILIFLICIFSIAFVLHTQFFWSDNIIDYNQNDSTEEDENNQIKSNFAGLFKNKVEILQDDLPDITKIHENYDLVVSAYTYQEKIQNCELDVSIPYINIKSDMISKQNKETSQNFREKAEELSKSNDINNTIYNVRYQAYVQNNILSLVIRAELKEDGKNQKIMIQTYNYDLIKNRQVQLEELLKYKNVSTSDAKAKIEKTIKDVQEQNNSFSEQGYEMYKRDYTLDIYKLENTKQYFLGNNGILYLIYAYGNNDYTSEFDMVIFK